MGIFYKNYSVIVRYTLSNMGACFSIQQKEEVQYTRYRPRPIDYTSLGEDTRRRIVQNPLCYFGKNCTRRNLEHTRKFSHDEYNYNGTHASKAESCKKYPDCSVSQSHLGGGSAGMVQQPKSDLDKSCVRNAGLALITSDNSIILVREKNGKLNFPSGTRKENEPSLDCAIREAEEELGIRTNQQVLNMFHRGLHTNQWKFVKRHRNLSQTEIYVFLHEQSSDWFNSNFRPNSECSAIIMMLIPEFIRNVEQSPHIFRFPESMRQFVAQLKTTISI